MSQHCRIDEAMADAKLLGAALGDLSTWSTWRTTLKAAIGVDLTEDEAATFAAASGGRKPPRGRVEQLWAIVGRRSGKTRMAALITSYLATCVDHSAYLAPGEVGHVLCLAPTQKQAHAVLGYCRAMLEASPILAQQIEAITSDEIRLSGNVCISVHPANFRTVRGRTLLAAVMDETSMWRDETSAQPDVEALRALLPALMTTKGMVIGISTPYAQRGLLFEKFRDHFGQDGDTLVVKGSTVQFNPTADEGWIEKQLAADPEANRAEYLAEFRGDWSAYVDRDTVLACVEADVHERPFAVGPRYTAFVDPSGGQHDSMTLGIAHRHGERVLLDTALEWKAPFDPTEVVTDIVAALRRYRCTQIIADRYAGAWVEGEFRKHGIYFKASDRDKSSIFLDALPLLTSGTAMLLDSPRLISQITQLQRETGKTGRDRVVKMRGAYDDLANAALGALVEAAAKRGMSYHEHDGGWPRPQPRVLLGYEKGKAMTRRRQPSISTRHRNGVSMSHIRKEIEMGATTEVEQHLVGDAGHWIQHHATAPDGRIKWAIFSPGGDLLAMKWGKTEAEAAVRELVTTGGISA